MKRSILLSIAFCIWSVTSIKSQTIEMEQRNLNAKLKILNQVEITPLINSWRTFVTDYGDFPELPHDSSTNQINFIFVENFNLNKSVIFNRVLEWGALTFGSLEAVLHYKDLESGKIIMKGSFSINYKEDYKSTWGRTKEQYDSKDVFATYVFTMKENKLKMQVEGILVEFSTRGYSNGSYYIPPTSRIYPLDALYPITDHDPILWKEHLNILKAINIEITATQRMMKKYISAYQQDYSF